MHKVAYLCRNTEMCVYVCVAGFRVSASDSLKTLSNRDELEDLLKSVEAWSLQKVNADISGSMLF